jgi:hypothetical protein
MSAANKADVQLRLTTEERDLLVRLLARELGDTRVELHHTHFSPEFRGEVKEEEAILRDLLNKLHPSTGPQPGDVAPPPGSCPDFECGDLSPHSKRTAPALPAARTAVGPFFLRPPFPNLAAKKTWEDLGCLSVFPGEVKTVRTHRGPPPKEFAMFARTLRTLIATLAVAVPLGAPAASRACDPPCCSYKTVVCYKRVVCYKTCYVPYTQTYTAYDDCGCPYTATRTCYREVTVPYTRLVAYKCCVPDDGSDN